MTMQRFSLFILASFAAITSHGQQLTVLDLDPAANSSYATVSGTVAFAVPDINDAAGVSYSVDGQLVATTEQGQADSVMWDTTSLPNGYYTVTAESESGATNKTASIMTTVLVSNPQGWLQTVDTGVWTQRDAGREGQSWDAGGKHMRFAHYPGDGKIYQLGGDFNGAPYSVNYRNDMYAYDIATDTFTKVQDYCRSDNGVQPGGPDQVGWAWDSTREVFWMTPGWLGDNGSACGGYPGSFFPSSTNPATMMTYDPAADRWTAETNRDSGQVGSNTRGAVQHDPVTDSLIRFSPDCAQVYDIQANRWSEPACLNITEVLGAQYTAFDPESRVVYVIGSVSDRLYAYDIDARTLNVVSEFGRSGNPPLVDGTWGGEDLAHIVWDPINRRLLYVQFQNNYGLGSPCQEPPPSAMACPPMQFHAYDPASDSWEVNIQQRTSFDPDPIPGNERVRGNAIVFDPFLNVLLLAGRNSNMWLYRYGDGSGGPPPATAPKSPSDLTAE